LEGNTVYFGEISLSGAIRPVSHSAMRLKEAEKLGFKAAFTPAFGEKPEKNSGIALTALRHLSELAAEFETGRENAEAYRRAAAG
jgi:DNA repair protein RadA/Sms